MFDSELVRIEERVLWLEAKLATLASPNEHSLKTDLGYRGMRTYRNTAPLGVTLDLGRECPVSGIYLVPAQAEFQGDPGIFPRRISIECSPTADFAETSLIYRSGDRSEPVDGIYPMEYPAHVTTRFVRILVNDGVVRGNLEIFGLSEIVVASDSHPVSFGAKVIPIGDSQESSIWNKASLVDGRSPLGTWQSGQKTSPTKGDAVFPEGGEDPVSWSLSLPAPALVRHIILFPYEINRSFGTFVLPERIEVCLENEGQSTSVDWLNPSPGGSHQTPIVIPVGQTMASSITITGVKPWLMGDQQICALSEIEVWSDTDNLASGRAIVRTHGNRESKTTELTDGYTSIQKILPCGAWFSQLNERSNVQKELFVLRPSYRNREERSELNATWGGSVLLGLTFLVPVFIFERRRLMSRQQLNLLRKRIASDLHDDIGSNLGSISLIARTARKDLARLHGPEEVARDLMEMESIARESSMAMRDIVWLLERRQDSIGDLFQRMRETSNRLLREFEVELDSQTARTATRLSLDAKRHLFLFFKEAIHNVLKHSKASKVRILIGDEGDLFFMEISDNGIGLPVNKESNQTSLAKLDDRARMLGAKLLTSSSPDSGTIVRLEVKRPSLVKTRNNR